MLLNPRHHHLPEAIRFVGLATVTPSSFNPDHDPNGTQIQDLFAALRDELASASISPVAALYGISCPADDVVPPQQIRYVAAVETSAACSGALKETVVPAGDFFAVTYQGAITGLDAAINEIYGDLFAASGYEPREGLHLEIYPPSWDPSDEQSSMDVLVPISIPGRS